jgi:DNA adenine methylase
VNSPLKWHGGKRYLAKRIVALMPSHTHYVEPYAGGLSVLLAKNPEGVSEVVNDIDGELTNFWRVLQTPEAFELMKRRLDATPFSEWEWKRANRRLLLEEIDVSNAAEFFVTLAGRMEDFAPLSRNRTRGGMNEQAAAWLSAVDRLPEVHARLRRVVVLNRDALTVIRQQDGPGTMFYLDPPYLCETRASPEVYAHEMTEQQHRELLNALCAVEGRFVLSGYRSAMYDDYAALAKWRRLDFELPNHAAGGKEKRKMIECVWCNFEPPVVQAPVER